MAAKKHPLRRMTRYAMKRKGLNNKFYEVEAQEREDGRADWTFRWGRIGTNGQSKTGDIYSYESALVICDVQFESKLKKGYVEANAMEALAAAVADVDERKTNGFDPVEIDIPCFHAGNSEKRCQRFATKWLKKLNLLRTSRWDLGDSYNKEINAMLKSYCKEWKRICETKTHGHLVENAHAQSAFRVYFSLLAQETKANVWGHFEGIGAL